MDGFSIDELALQLSDLELAVLLCLAAHEHCLLETTKDSIHDVAKELALISSNTFGLCYAILDCSPSTTLADFSSEILAAGGLGSYHGPAGPMKIKRSPSYSTQGSRDHVGRTDDGHSLDGRKVVNVIIAKHFNRVNEDIQIRILELLRSKQLTIGDAVLTAPTNFLFLPLVVRKPEQFQPPLNKHLNDHLFISHFHDSSMGYAHLEDVDDWLSDGQESISSVVRKPDTRMPKKGTQINEQALRILGETSKTVTANADVIRYQQDIVSFLRLSRAVAGGISPKTNNHFSKLAKLLAQLHGIDYLTPSIIALASKKVFCHRIILARPEDDRSLQYGSDLKAVAQVLSHLTPEMVLDDVLSQVDAPV